MTFALYANTVSPHQLPLAREIVSCLGAENYRYIYTDQLPPERVNLGWGDAGAPWLMPYSSPGAAEWLRDADVVMMQHHRDWNLLEDRLSRGKTCLYPSERWFKPRLGMIRLLWPRYFMMARRFVRMLEKYDRLFYLPQGIHAARDMARLCGLMHGDLRCLFGAPEVEFERQPGGRIFLTQSSREAEKQRGSKCCLEKMRMWGYFVEKSFGNADANLAEVTVVATHKRKKKIPPSANRRPLAEVVETVAKHQAAGFSPSTTTSIVSKLGAARKGEGAADSHQSLAAGCLPGEDAVKLTTPPLLHSSTLKVLWVGRLLGLKRVDTIIRAVGELAVSSRNRRLSVARDSSEPSRAQASAERLAVSEASTRATRSARLTISLDIYGSGPEEARLKKLAAKYGDVIKFHPPVPIGEVRGLMREHDVYVLSSNGYEGWGAVVSEALEEGMKVLGTYEAGSSATMLPTERLFHAGDWHTLAEFLCKAANGELKPTGIGEWSAEKAAEWLLAVSG